MYITKVYLRKMSTFYSVQSKILVQKFQLLCMGRRQDDVSGLLFKYFAWTSTWSLTPLPPSACVNLSLTTPLRVDVISGRPLICSTAPCTTQQTS